MRWLLPFFVLALLPACATMGHMPPPTVAPPTVEAGPLGDGYQVRAAVAVEWGPIDAQPQVLGEIDGHGGYRLEVAVPITVAGTHARASVVVHGQQGGAHQVVACIEAPELLPVPVCRESASEPPGGVDPLTSPEGTLDQPIEQPEGNAEPGGTETGDIPADDAPPEVGDAEGEADAP